MSSIQVFDYDDYTPQQFLVCYEGKRYILTEANEWTAVQFRNTPLKDAKFTIPQGKDGGSFGATMGNAAEVQSVLVGGCLCHTDPDPNAPNHLKDKNGKGWRIKRDKNNVAQSVGIPFVKGMPSAIVKPLFEKAKDISKLSESGPESTIGNTTTNHDDPSSPEANGVDTHRGYDSPKDLARSPISSS